MTKADIRFVAGALIATVLYYLLLILTT